MTDLSLVSKKSTSLTNIKINLLPHTWRCSIFRFSNYNFFLRFTFKKLTFSSFLLQDKKLGFLDAKNFNFSKFSLFFTSGKLINFLLGEWWFVRNYFFCEFRILGLGLKLKRSSYENLKVLKFDLGYGHYINYFLPPQLKCIRRKKKFVIFSPDLILLNNVVKHLESFKPLNPYKVRGLRNIRRYVKIKVGKKQSQR